MNILFIVPYPVGAAGSQRFRFEQYFKLLEKNGHRYKVASFLDAQTWIILYLSGHLFRKMSSLFSGYCKRFFLLFQLGKYDAVFIHREAAPFGPPVFEWFITKVFKKYTVYDFDDAIWLSNASETNNKLTRTFKRFKNINDICKWASVVSAGNSFLADFAKKYNPNVVINPTTIDTDDHHNQTTDHSNPKMVIGWTGSHSTLQYLDLIFPVLQMLEEKFDFEFHVICDTSPKFKLRSMIFKKWSKESEIEDLLDFNIGIMPLPDDIWTKGKCGFKALQYMSLGIPAVVSDVGVNATIVDDGINGCVCRTEADWYNALSRLMTDPGYLKQLSEKTRDKIVQHYSVKSNEQNFLSLLER